MLDGMFTELAVLPRPDVGVAQADAFAGRGNTEELALVGTAHRPTGGDFIPLGYHLVNDNGHVGKSSPEHTDRHLETFASGNRSLQTPAEMIGRKQFVGDTQISLTH